MTGFTFFQNYYEAINDEENGLTEEEQGRLYNTIFAYMFRDEAPVLKGACKLAFNLIKPSLDLSKTRSNARSKNQNAVGENQSQIKTEQNEIKSDLSPFFENKEQEERSKNNCSFVLSPGARDDEGLIGFLKAHPNVKNDVWDISELSFVDFRVLSQKLSESEFLRKTKSLSWLIKNYRDIVADKYRDYEKRRRGDRSDTSNVLAEMYRQAEEEDRLSAKSDSG